MDCKNQKGIKKHNYIINLLIFALLTALTFFFVCKKIDWYDIYPLLMQLKVEYLVIAIAVSLMYIIFEGLGYKALMKPLGRNISIPESVTYASINIYFSAITPSAIGGQPAVAFSMKRNGIPYTHSSIVLLLNVVLYTFALLTFTVIAIIINPTLIFKNGTYITVLFFMGTTVTIGLALLCVFAMFSSDFLRKLGHVLIFIGCKLKFISDGDAKMEKLEEHLREYKRSRIFISKNKKALLLAFTCNMLQRVANYSVAYFIYRGLGCSGISYAEIMSTQILIAASVSFVPLPGAVGITEAVFVKLLSYIYPHKLIYPAMLLTRTIGYYFCVIVSAFITIAGNFIIFKHKKTDNLDYSSEVDDNI